MDGWQLDIPSLQDVIEPTEVAWTGGPEQQQGTTCPDCRWFYFCYSFALQPVNALQLVRCPQCGCTFCARCAAQYIRQPAQGLDQNSFQAADGAATDARLHDIAAAAATAKHLLATCSCGAVSRSAVQHQWGPAAVACWPATNLVQQLLLLLLLQRYQQQVLPLLSKQLLQRVQQSSLPDLLQWQHVQQLAHHNHQQQQQQQPGSHMVSTVEIKPQQPQQHGQRHRAASPQDDLIPAAAVPAFQAPNGRRHHQSHTPVDMDLCDGSIGQANQHPVEALSAAEAAAVARRICVEAPCSTQQVHADHMQVDDMQEDAKVVHVATLLQQEQQQPQQQQAEYSLTMLSPGSFSADEASKLQQAQDSMHTLRLAQHVLAAEPQAHDMMSQGELELHAGEQLAAVADGTAGTAQAVAASAGWPANGVPEQADMQRLHGSRHAGLPDSPRGQLGMEDFEGPVASQPLASVHLEQLQNGQQEHQATAQSVTHAVLPRKGGPLQLIEDADSDSRSQGEPSRGLPRLTDFGLQAAKPPMVADDPVVLIAENDQSTLPFWQRD